jgi:phage terminase large subunit-like protein
MRNKRAEKLLALGDAQRRAEMRRMNPTQLRELQPYWALWAHPGQRTPVGSWHTWLIMAGRAIIYFT